METINKISDDEIEIVEQTECSIKISKSVLLKQKEELDEKLARINNYLKEFD